MRVTALRLQIITLLVFIALTIGGFIGTIAMVELLATTNRLIYALLVPLGIYLTIIFTQCMLKSFDTVFDS